MRSATVRIPEIYFHHVTLEAKENMTEEDLKIKAKELFDEMKDYEGEDVVAFETIKYPPISVWDVTYSDDSYELEPTIREQ